MWSKGKGQLDYLEGIMKRWIAKDSEIANREEFNTEVSLSYIELGYLITICFGNSEILLALYKKPILRSFCFFYCLLMLLFYC